MNGLGAEWHRQGGEVEKYWETLLVLIFVKGFSDDIRNVECHQASPLSSSWSIINVHSQKQLPHCPHTDVRSAPLSDICVDNMNFMHWHWLASKLLVFSSYVHVHTDVLCLTKSHIAVLILDASHTVLSAPSGTRLTGWTSLKHWWRRTRGSWRIWETCADRCASWRSATPCTCSAPASWRRSSAGPTLPAISWTPTRDRQAVGRKEEGEWYLFLCWRPSDVKHSLARARVWKTLQFLWRALANTDCCYALWLAGPWASHQALGRGHESWEMAVWVQEPSRQVWRTAEGERSELVNIVGKSMFDCCG